MSKIKVLHLFDSYLNQTENWAYNLIRHLPDTSVHIAANHYLKNDFYDSRFKFCDNYYDGLRAYGLKLKRKSLFKKAIIKIIPHLLGKPEHRIIQYAKQQKIDIVHAHFANVAWNFRTIPRKLKVPFVVSFYGWDYEMLPHTDPKYKKRYQQLFDIADQFVCEGIHGRKILLKMGCPKYKINVVQLGVKVEKIKLRERTKKVNQLNLIQVASFNEKKGHIYTVKAFLRAVKTCPNMTLTLVGADQNNGIKQDIIRLKNKSRHSNKIKIKNRVDFSKLHYYFKDYQVFIHPSCYAENRDCEGGAPIVLLDAQATGMPVISTRHCDIPDEVIHEKTGLLAPEKNVTALTKHIEYFYKMNQRSYNKFSQEARHHILTNYNVEDKSLKLQRLYNKLVKK